MPNNDDKILAQDLYQQIYAQLKLNPRTIQWYATEGLLPKPTKIGTDAYYDDSAQIWARLQVILILQKRHNQKLKEIKQIIDGLKDADWESVLTFLQALQDTFPMTKLNQYGHEIVNEKGWKIGGVVMRWLKEGRQPDAGWLTEVEEEAEKKPDYDDWESF